jgi:hypothetical protein
MFESSTSDDPSIVPTADGVAWLRKHVVPLWTVENGFDPEKRQIADMTAEQIATLSAKLDEKFSSSGSF